MSTRRVRVPWRRGLLQLLGAVIVLASSASVAAGAGPKAGQPLAYSFRITVLDVTATFTKGKSTVKTRLRLEGPSRERTLVWVGRKLGPSMSGIGPTLVSLAGEATYSSPDPGCSGKLALRSSRARSVPVTLFYFGTRVHVYVQKFPLATVLPGRDSGVSDDPSLGRCGTPLFDWYETANIFRPPAVFRSPSFTVTAQRKERFEDGEAIEWTLRMTVKRIRLRLIDCNTHPGC
jgi:hypothetical protein